MEMWRPVAGPDRIVARAWRGSRVVEWLVAALSAEEWVVEGRVHAASAAESSSARAYSQGVMRAEAGWVKISLADVAEWLAGQGASSRRLVQLMLVFESGWGEVADGIWSAGCCCEWVVEWVWSCWGWIVVT